MGWGGWIVGIQLNHPTHPTLNLEVKSMVLPHDIKKMTSDKWCKELNINQNHILDPDGRDRTNWKFSFYEQAIDKEAFRMRLIQSTCMLTDEILKVSQGI